MKEEIIAKIREIASDEKFKLDAIFFCGFPSELPNEALIKACDAYLETVDRGEHNPEVVQKLITELEAAVAKKSAVPDVNNIMNTKSQMQEVLDHKEVLL